MDRIDRMVYDPEECIVHDPDTTMGYKYRARIVTVPKRKKIKYRGFIDQHFREET